MSPDNTIICRCEDLTLEEVREYIRQGHTTFEDLKRVSRCGMGPCQGKTCHLLILSELAAFNGTGIEHMVPPSVRPVTKPVPLGTIAGETGGHDTKK